jgi:hypothetical protein
VVDADERVELAFAEGAQDLDALLQLDALAGFFDEVVNLATSLAPLRPSSNLTGTCGRSGIQRVNAATIKSHGSPRQMCS